MNAFITMISAFNRVFLLFVLYHQVSTIKAYFNALILEKLLPNQTIILQMNIMTFSH
jgi:hypothetical protein